MDPSRPPPGPPGQPLRGVLPWLSADWLGCLERWQRQYGDIVWLPMPPRMPPAVLLGRPDLVEQVLVSDAALFRKSALERRVRVAIGDGLFTSEGALWRRQRRMVQPFFQRARIAAYGDTMTREAARLAERWAPGGPRDVFADCLDLALRVVARTLFDVDLEELTAAVGEAFGELSETLQGWFQVGMPTPGIGGDNVRRMREAMRRLEAVVYRLIAERRGAPAGAERSDLLSRLVSARDEDGSAMTDRQLRDEVMTLLIAGSETIALALAWGLDLLATHPEAAARLRAEAGALGDRLPAAADLPALAFADSVAREVLRLYPPTWVFSHAPVQDWTVGGYHIPRDTTVLLCPYLMHRDARYFAAPERFRPERWTDGSLQSLHRYAYFPFGGGQRVCLGHAFAMMEIVLALATLVPRVELAPLPARRPRPLPHFTLRPAGGLWLEVALRAASGGAHG